jgi:hypothetical protein
MNLMHCQTFPGSSRSMVEFLSQSSLIGVILKERTLSTPMETADWRSISTLKHILRGTNQWSRSALGPLVSGVNQWSKSNHMPTFKSMVEIARSTNNSLGLKSLKSTSEIALRELSNGF